MPTFFQDTFTEASDTTLASHTPDTGTGWTVLIQVGGGTMKVDSTPDTAVRESGGLSDGVLYTADATYSSANYSAEVVSVTPDSLDDPCILAVRIQDSDNMYALYFNEDSFQLYKKLAGTWSSLTLDQGAQVVANDTVKLEINGTTLTAYVNDSSVVSATDSSHSAAGKAGLGMGAVITSGDDMSSQEFDDFLVEDIAAGTDISSLRQLIGHGRSVRS